MKENLFLFFLILSFCSIFTKKNGTKKNTFLLRTNLTKDVLITLFENSGKPNMTTYIKESCNATFIKTRQNNETEEEPDDDLLEEFLDTNDKKVQSTVLVSKANSNNIVKEANEKKFSRIYGYLAILLFIFALYYYREALIRKKNRVKKIGYINYYNSFNTNDEYILEKIN